jgi:hypothetical protein
MLRLLAEPITPTLTEAIGVRCSGEPQRHPSCRAYGFENRCSVRPNAGTRGSCRRLLEPTAQDLRWVTTHRIPTVINVHAHTPHVCNPLKLRLRFVRFSGQSLTQGVVNMKIDGVPVRIYSAAKIVADCLKYRRKIGRGLAAQIRPRRVSRCKPA